MIAAAGSELVILGARWKALLLVAGAIGFVWLGVWLLAIPRWDARIIGAVSVLFFGFCGVAGVFRLVRPVRVVLGPEGFRMEYPPWRPRRVAWRDVEAFFIWRHQTVSIVGFNYVPGRAPELLSVRINRGLGLDDSLPPYMQIGPKRLLALMQEWHARAVQG